MTYKEITDLIKLVNKTELTEFKLREKEFEIQIRTSKYQKVKGSQTVIQTAAPAPAPVMAPAAAPVAAAPVAESKPDASAEKPKASADVLEVKSPIVGTFYRSSAPDKPPYKKVGDRVEAGEVVCIVEAMKLFNEIESEVSGTIVQVLAEDASPVEYDQVLFLVDPS